MNTLYLHIGTTKTGTTAIQAFCMENQELLNRKGYCYPKFPFRYANVSERRNAHFLIGEGSPEPDARAGLIRTGGRQPGAFRAGMKKVRRCFQKYHSVILSDEGIWSEPYKKREKLWEALLAQGREHGFAIRVVVYLRRQDSYLASTWNQRVKSGVAEGADEPWDSYAARRADIGKLDYGRRVDGLVNVFGRENVIVRRFEPGKFYQGSLYADFLNAVGLELTDEYRIEKTVRNESLKGNTHEIKRILNGLPSPDAKGQSFFRRALLSFSQLSGRLYPVSMFSEEERRLFLEPYGKGNRKIAAEFFGEEELFSQDGEETEKWRKGNPQMTDDIVRFAGACFLQLLAVQQRQEREIAQLRRKL